MYPTNRGAAGRERTPKLRWECSCCDPPILLARYDPDGKVQIKVRDRYYYASGCVHATCPQCGTLHVLDLRPAGSASDGGAAGPVPVPGSGGWW